MSEETVLKAEVNKKFNKSYLPAALLIVAGLVLLGINLLNIQVMEFLWPGFIVGTGMVMMWPAYKSTAEQQSKLSFFAIPGAMTVALGVLLGLMNAFDHYESMAYAWTLILAAAAGGYLYMKRFEPEGSDKVKAHKFIRAMVLAFMGLVAFFELLVFQSLGGWWPLLIVGLGIYLLAQNRRSVKDV